MSLSGFVLFFHFSRKKKKKKKKKTLRHSFFDFSLKTKTEKQNPFAFYLQKETKAQVLLLVFSCADRQIVNRISLSMFTSFFSFFLFSIQNGILTHNRFFLF